MVENYHDKAKKKKSISFVLSTLVKRPVVNFMFTLVSMSLQLLGNCTIELRMNCTISWDKTV